ncbi:MAG: hypothetical protein WD314_16855 [Trueperaceae bacterium]
MSSSALERRVKRWLLQAPFDVFVQVTPGLEGVLLGELADLGLAGSGGGATAERGGEALALDLDGVMRVNLELRTAGRVMLRLGSFPAATPEMLVGRARKLPWEVHLGFYESYALRMSSRRSKLQGGGYLAKTVGAAIGRRMGEVGLAPRLADDAPLAFHVRLQDDRCTLSLDTSGEHLHRRNVRRHVHAAPLRETLAAAVVLEGLAGMEGRPDVVVDPFCGSGTLLLEAVDLLSGLPPGRRRSFAFEEAAWHRPGRWREVRRRAGLDVGDGGVSSGGDGAARVASGSAATGPRAPAAPLPAVLGLDSDGDALDASRLNLSHPEYRSVELRQRDSLSFDFDTLGASRGLIVANLPYGVRLGERQEADEIVSSFLRRLAGGRTRWRVALLSANPGVVETRLRHARTLATSNGGLRVWLTTGEIGGA